MEKPGIYVKSVSCVGLWELLDDGAPDGIENEVAQAVDGPENGIHFRA